MSQNGGKMEGRIRTSFGGTWTFTLSDSGGSYSATTFDAADYYLSSPGTGSRSLLGQLESELNGASSVDGYTVSLSASTGLVTIAKSSGTFSITWGGATGLREVLGFTANISSASSATASNQSPALWIPGSGWDAEFDGESSGWHVSDDTVTVAPDGTRAHLGYNIRTEQAIAYRMLTAAKTRTGNETTTNESLETFWRQNIWGEATFANRGNPIRWYPSYTDNATYYTYGVKNANEFHPRRSLAGFTVLYDFEWQLLLEV